MMMARSVNGHRSEYQVEVRWSRVEGHKGE